MCDEWMRIHFISVRLLPIFIVLISFIYSFIFCCHHQHHHHHWARVREMIGNENDGINKYRISTTAKKKNEIPESEWKRIKKFAMLIFLWKLLRCYFKISVPFVCVCFFFHSLFYSVYILSAFKFPVGFCLNAQTDRYSGSIWIEAFKWYTNDDCGGCCWLQLGGVI